MDVDITTIDGRVYLEKLSAFSRILQQKGLPVSPQKTADAARILTALGLEDRQQVKTALCTVFATSRDEQLIFEKVFDGFFLSEEAIRKQLSQEAAAQQEQQQVRQQAQEELQQANLNEQQLDTYAAMPEQERQKLQGFLDRYKESAVRSPELYSNFIHSVFAKALLEQQMRMEQTELGGLEKDPELGLLFRDISTFQDTQIPKAIHLIRAITQQINGRLSSQNKRKTHHGKLDFRRTIRKGLSTGGSLQKLSYRKKPSRKKQLVVLCDVSGSMMQFSEFALRFIQSLNQVSDHAKVFLFSETLAQADAFSMQNMDLFRDYVRRCGIYGKGTDLGGALSQLCSMPEKVLNQSTTLLILSDTKTIDHNAAIAACEQAKRLCGRVLWLNPIPKHLWKYSRSIRIYENLCPMVCCNTLQDLAQACAKLIL